MAALPMIHHPGPACANITASSLLARLPVRKSQVTPFSSSFPPEPGGGVSVWSSCPCRIQATDCVRFHEVEHDWKQKHKPLCSRVQTESSATLWFWEFFKKCIKHAAPHYIFIAFRLQASCQPASKHQQNYILLLLSRGGSGGKILSKTLNGQK